MPRYLKALHYQLFLLLLLLVLCAVIYRPGLGGPMLLDDFPQLSGLMESDSQDWHTLAGNYLLSNSGQLGRPVSMASFIASAMLHGNDLRYWKAANLLIHLMTALVVFFLARVLLRATSLAAGKEAAGWLALLVAGLWLLHPLQVSTVLYTVQRMSQLAALFCFAGLLAYSSGRMRQVSASGGGWWQIAVAWLVCLPLAVLSKENGVLLLLLLPLVELVVFRGASFSIMHAKSSRYRFAVTLLPAIVGGVYLLLHFDQLVLNSYAAREFTLTERLLTQSRVLVTYLCQLLVPLPRLMGFYHDDIVLSRGLVNPVSTLGSMLLLAGLLWLAWRLRRYQPLVTLGILFFFIAHALESTIFPLEMMFEHRNYLASFGVLLAVVAVLARLGRQPWLPASVGIVLLLVCSSLTWVRAGIWGSTPLLMQHIYAVHPDSKRLIVINANRYADGGDYPRALTLLGRYDDPGFRLNRLYIGCLRDGRIADGELQEMIAAMQGVVNDQAMTGLIGIANLGLDGKCAISGRLFLALMDRAAAARIQAISLQKLHLYRAHYLQRLEGLDAALTALEAAFSVDSANPVPLFLATEWLLDAGQVERARSVYARALWVVADSHHDYSDFTGPIGARLDGATE